MNGLECENAFDNDPNTHWVPASSWQQQDYDNNGKISYADHETGQYKRGEQPVLTLLLDQYIGLKNGGNIPQREKARNFHSRR